MNPAHRQKNMTEQQHKSTSYDKSPEVAVQGFDHAAWQGWQAVAAAVSHKIATLGLRKTLLVVDCYHGVSLAELIENFINPLQPVSSVNAESAKYDEPHIHAMIERNLTDDRVFGVLSCHEMSEFFDAERVQQLRDQIASVDSGLVVVYGPGAALIAEADVLVYADMARWEIQQRFRRGELGNWGVNNVDEDVLRRYKRAFFVEWRVLDRHKTPLLQRADFVLDTNQAGQPKLVTGTAFHAGLQQATQRPFRV
ncbi:mannose-6-phosphate isomerase, partial [Serratia proteamaculans]|nr:mannose-6-phosphate isomerase [Serratia proteamaculans]